MSKINDLSSFSIKTFVTDLARILNKNFGIIKNVISTFFEQDGDYTTLSASKVTATGVVHANTVEAKQFKYIDGSTAISISDLAARVATLETENENLWAFVETMNAWLGSPISKEEIENL